MTLRTKLDMADTWSEDVEARLITSWQNFPLLYLISITVSNERAFREIAEEINMTGSICDKITIYLPNLK